MRHFEDLSLLEPGCVWHGPWHTGLRQGSFGSPQTRHWAMVFPKDKLKQDGHELICSFFPFTSKKNNNALVVLPPGTFSFGRNCESYLVPFRLLITQSYLQHRFTYKTKVASCYVDAAIKEYILLLKARKKHKKGNTK